MWRFLLIFLSVLTASGAEVRWSMWNNTTSPSLMSVTGKKWLNGALVGTFSVNRPTSEQTVSINNANIGDTVEVTFDGGQNITLGGGPVTTSGHLTHTFTACCVFFSNVTISDGPCTYTNRISVVNQESKSQAYRVRKSLGAGLYATVEEGLIAPGRTLVHEWTVTCGQSDPRFIEVLRIDVDPVTGDVTEDWEAVTPETGPGTTGDTNDIDLNPPSGGTYGSNQPPNIDFGTNDLQQGFSAIYDELGKIRKEASDISGKTTAGNNLLEAIKNNTAGANQANELLSAVSTDITGQTEVILSGFQAVTNLNGALLNRVNEGFNTNHADLLQISQHLSVLTNFANTNLSPDDRGNLELLVDGAEAAVEDQLELMASRKIEWTPGTHDSSGSQPQWVFNLGVGPPGHRRNFEFDFSLDQSGARGGLLVELAENVKRVFVWLVLVLYALWVLKHTSAYIRGVAGVNQMTLPGAGHPLFTAFSKAAFLAVFVAAWGIVLGLISTAMVEGLTEAGIVASDLAGGPWGGISGLFASSVWIANQFLPLGLMTGLMISAIAFHFSMFGAYTLATSIIRHMWK